MKIYLNMRDDDAPPLWGAVELGFVHGLRMSTFLDLLLCGLTSCSISDVFLCSGTTIKVALAEGHPTNVIEQCSFASTSEMSPAEVLEQAVRLSVPAMSSVLHCCQCTDTICVGLSFSCQLRGKTHGDSIGNRIFRTLGSH